ncbi:hypothetical protein L6452_32935 [Arctium lappa]|uniref:Uncharacterized protein n=1 Tax=Arctium lappa TaxID=4217 RepID=A0ACB8Z732_ARCLA|nr:hypothetical protein L6452_32935 [Arctium lappa]
MLKVSPWKRIIQFGKRGKLSRRFLGPFVILEKIGLQAYRLELPPEMDGIHPTFHVCYLRKCLAEEESAIPLTEIRVDNGNRCVEEPEAILESKVKKLRHQDVIMVKPSCTKNLPTQQACNGRRQCPWAKSPWQSRGGGSTLSTTPETMTSAVVTWALYACHNRQLGTEWGGDAATMPATMP